MSFKNPKQVSFYVDQESAFLTVSYVSSIINKEVTQDSVKSKVYITPRTYKCLVKVKNNGSGLDKTFLLPIFQVCNRKIDPHYFVNYIVQCSIGYVPSYQGMHLSASFTTDRKNEYGRFIQSDEFLFVLSVNLNHFITDFAKTFRLKPDPNISLEEYFDSYYQSTNFVSIIENSNGEVLR
jgi:hypothetical protein